MLIRVFNLGLILNLALSISAIPTTYQIDNVLTENGLLNQPRQNVAASDPAPSLKPEVEPTPKGPPTAVNNGTLTCQASMVGFSNPLFYMGRDEAVDAINTVCGKISNGVVFTYDVGVPFQYMRHDGLYEFPMIVGIEWYPNGRTDCPALDFANATARATCKQMLTTNIDSCNPEGEQLQYGKGGGSFIKDCLIWSIQRVTNIAPSE